MSIVIHTKDLVKSYRARTVVNHVSIEVKQGEIVGLLGPNGAGKTTTFYMTVGLIKPDEGEVYLNDRNITSLPMYKRAQMGIGYLPQEASVFRKLSVEDNISAVLEMTKLSRKQQKERLEMLLSEFRLSHVRKSNGDVLSGGERRRTEIARALAVDPKFILLDEPFAGIDPIAVEDIQAIVAKLKYKNIGILITDHNVTETLSICDRAYLLIEGKIFKHGSAEELAVDEQVKKLYLGRNFELKRKDWLLNDVVSEQGNIKLSNYVQWMIDHIDSITQDLPAAGQPGYETITDQSLFNEFRHSFSDVVKAIESAEIYKAEEKLHQYVQELKTIDMGVAEGSNPLDDAVTTITGIPFNQFNTEQVKEVLTRARSIFEKCKLIIDNPEFSNVLN